MTPETPPRPTSSRPRPATGDDLPNATSSLVPTPLGDEVAKRRPGHPTKTTHHLVPGTRSEPPTFNSGTVWLITPRTHPAWTATLDLLSDHQWHPRTDITRAMRAAADLADRTIDHHLRAASCRRWIQQSRNRIRIRDRAALEQALDSMEPTS